jgi:hypothetical protein
VLAQLVEDLVHLEGRGSVSMSIVAFTVPAGDPERVLGEEEHVVPEAGLEVVLHLGEVEVGAGAAGDGLLRVVEEVEPEVEEGAGDVAPVDQRGALAEVPAARTHEEHRGALVERYACRCHAVKEMVRRTASRRLIWPETSLSQVGEVGVLAVGHERVAPGVERVDDHLALDGAGDLHAAVEEVGRERRHAPVARADVRGLGEEIPVGGGLQGRGARAAPLQQRVDAGAELSHQAGDEGQRLGRQHLLVAGAHRATDLDSRQRRHRSPSGSVAGNFTPRSRSVNQRARVLEKNGCQRPVNGHALCCKFVYRRRAWRRRRRRR